MNNYNNMNEYLTAQKAYIMTLEAQRINAAKDYKTECVLKQITEATKSGSFEIETYDDNDIRDNLVLLGFECSEAYKDTCDVYMKVSWINFL